MNRYRTEKTAPVPSLAIDLVRRMSKGSCSLCEEPSAIPGGCQSSAGSRLYEGAEGNLAKGLVLHPVRTEQNSRFLQEWDWGQFERSQISFPGSGGWVLTCDVRLWVHDGPGVTGLAVKLCTIPIGVFVLCERDRQLLEIGVHVYSWLCAEGKPMCHIYIMLGWAKGVRSSLGLQYQFSFHAWLQVCSPFS